MNSESVIPEKLKFLAEQWLKWDTNEETRREIVSLLDEGNEKELNLRIGQRLQFGTAGLRGKLRAGFNSMNDLVVRQTSQGLCRSIEQLVGNPYSRGVCIGYDGRHKSMDFANVTARVFVSRGFRVFLYNRVVPTPLVPFCVTRKKCAAGIMITASHNPKEDNGYKVFWENGCQIVSPIDTHIAASIESSLEPWNLSALRLDLIEDITSEIIESYIGWIGQELCFHRTTNSKSKLKIVYTPVHGVGQELAAKAFDVFGLPLFVSVPLQMHPDPDFPTAPFPNPEEGLHVLAPAVEMANSCNASLIVATDPDADRLSVVERMSNGRWRQLSGNEIGILLGHWYWKQFQCAHPAVPPGSCVMISTAVSSQLLRKMSEGEGLLYEETLTGFKWMGTAAYDHIRKGRHFLFAFEEAIGYMIGDVALDKDGIRAAAVFAELASHRYAAGQTCVQYLEEIYEQYVPFILPSLFTKKNMYGFFLTKNGYFFCYDPKKMTAIFQALRSSGQYPTSCGAFKVANVRDLTAGYDSMQPDRKPILPVSKSSEMVSFYFECGGLVTLRGSGTEPKLKYYAELNGRDRPTVQKTLDDLVQAVIENFLRPTENCLVSP